MPVCLLLAALGVALADHGQVVPQLAGTTLCLDPLSVQVEVTGPRGEEQTAPLTHELRRRLEVALTRVEVRPSCFGHPATLLLNLDARYLDPKTYVGFPENAHTYVVSAQVGRLAETDDLVLTELLYSTSTSDIISVEENRELLEVASPTLSELAQAWRRDNIIPVGDYLVFAGLALLLVGARVLALIFKLRCKTFARPRPGRF